MGITDELREYVSHYSVAGSTKDKLLTAIADRIDAEHERAVRYERCAFWHDASDDELANYGLLRAPIDADDEYIHIGDVMENIVHPTTHREVTAIGAECFYAWVDEQGHWSQFDASCYRHYHAPTVEDVMVEFATDWECAEDGEDKTAVLKEYAKRLTLASDVE